MTFGRHTPDEQPSAAELDRVRALLASLGEERAPDAVVERLELVLAAQLPSTPPSRSTGRRPRSVRGRVLAFAAPLAVAAVIGAVVLNHGGGNGAALPTAGNAPAAASEAAITGAKSAPSLAAPAPVGGATATDSSSATEAAPAPALAAPKVELEDAARSAYDAVDLAIRRHRHATP